jgi:hypothetical protein
LSFHRFSLPSSQFRPAVFFASSCARFNLHRWSSVFGCFLRAERAALAGFGFASSLRTVQLLGARFPAIKPSSLVFLVWCHFFTIAGDLSSPVLILTRRIKSQVFWFLVALLW